jgi:hypothetical protein
VVETTIADWQGTKKTRLENASIPLMIFKKRILESPDHLGLVIKSKLPIEQVLVSR